MEIIKDACSVVVLLTILAFLGIWILGRAIAEEVHVRKEIIKNIRKRGKNVKIK